MRYLICYDVHDSEEHPEVYTRIKDTLTEKFKLFVKCTESVYLFETKKMNLDILKLLIRLDLNFIPNLEFHVFQLTDKLDMEANLKYCNALLERNALHRDTDTAHR